MIANHVPAIAYQCASYDIQGDDQGYPESIKALLAAAGVLDAVPFSPDPVFSGGSGEVPVPKPMSYDWGEAGERAGPISILTGPEGPSSPCLDLSCPIWSWAAPDMKESRVVEGRDPCLAAIQWAFSAHPSKASGRALDTNK